MSESKLHAAVAKKVLGFKVAPFVGSPLTHKVGHVLKSAIDFILINEAAASLSPKVEVNTTLDISDHFPVVIDIECDWIVVQKRSKPRLNKHALSSHANTVLYHNYWAPLQAQLGVVS